VRLQILLNVLRGFLMGSADVVPGVSGGTIAVLVGIYERLVAAVSLASKALGRAIALDFRGAASRLRAIEWSLIVPLLLGIGLAIVLLAGILSYLLDAHPEVMAGAFTGLVAASAWVAARMLKRPRWSHAAVVAVVAVMAFVLLGLKGGEVSNPSWPVIFGAGAIAICAMILPGISGSFLLLMMGMYDVIINAVNDRDLAILLVFGLGCIVGLALFSQALDWSLRTHHDIVVAAMVGLMIGSFRVLWPWPDGVESVALGAPGGDWALPAVTGIAAAAVVVVLTLLIERRPATRRGVSAKAPSDS
jgi:putative membrane protein